MKRMKPDTQKFTNYATGKVYYINTITGEPRKKWWTKARIPGTVRKSRMPGGSGFRNNWEYPNA